MTFLNESPVSAPNKWQISRAQGQHVNLTIEEELTPPATTRQHKQMLYYDQQLMWLTLAGQSACFTISHWPETDISSDVFEDDFLTVSVASCNTENEIIQKLQSAHLEKRLKGPAF